MTDFDKGIELINKFEKYNGYVMRGNNEVAEVIDGKINNVKHDAPVYIKRTRNFREWIKDRGADINRSYVRSILKRLGLPLQDIAQAVMAVRAASVTDIYWIKGKNENIKYENVSFSNDDYFKAALSGDPDIYTLPKKETPEITSIGSYNKGWKLEHDGYYLYKDGNANEIFSELFTSKLALSLGLNAVCYSVEKYNDKYFIKCKNFTGGELCFEPAKGIVGSNQDYKYNCEKMSELGLLNQYMDLIFTDAIVRNGDRHEFNYGVITCCGNILRMAPNFDNNMSLFWSGIPSSLKRNDPLVDEFIDVYKEYDYNLPVISKSLLENVYNDTYKEFPAKIKKEDAVEFCFNAYKRIKEKECLKKQ